jgi:hypothetical protein
MIFWKEPDKMTGKFYKHCAVFVALIGLAACAEQAPILGSGGYSGGDSLDDLKARVDELEDQDQQLQSDIDDLQLQQDQ